MSKGFDYKESWVDADGNSTKIKELTDRHLLNILSYMERNAEPLASADQWSMVSFMGTSSEASLDAMGSADFANDLIDEHYGIKSIEQMDYEDEIGETMTAAEWNGRHIMDASEVDMPDDVKREIASTHTDLEWIQRHYEPYLALWKELDRRTSV